MITLRPLATAAQAADTVDSESTSGTNENPFAPAQSICFSVTGEQLPERTAMRSTAPADTRGLAWPRQCATKAYSTPDEPTTNRAPRFQSKFPALERESSSRVSINSTSA